jgi:homopolymeric O-antigen transport system ATP-binding protein
MRPAIGIENLSKEFLLGPRQFGRYQTLREAIMTAAARPWAYLRGRSPQRAASPKPREAANRMWALKDVSFEVQPGEVVGLIGRNGAGKSTLLKILSRITEPTEGRVLLRGRVGSLLEVGTGFHPELTGRENIFLNGAILGMSRHEIDRKFDEIVAFAEMDQFLDTPVKRYSSGMYVRLAFAVAAHLELEILLVDEVLAVGDMDFQKKCLQKMGTIAQGGRTVIFVSHNLGLVHRLCGRAILLRNGQVYTDGPVADVIGAYLNENLSHEGRWERPAGLPAAKEVVLRRACVLGTDGQVTGVVNCDDDFAITIDYEVLTNTPNFEVAIGLRNNEGVNVVVSLDSDTGNWPDRSRPAGMYSSVCRIPRHLLAPGTYFLTFSAHIINQQTYESQADALAFEVAETGCIRAKRNDRRNGIITPVFDWEITRLA